MAKLRPFLAVDLETTGLDIERSHILQIGWVIDDGGSPRDQLERGSVIIKENVINYGESFALGMNGWLFQEMSKKDPKYPVMDLAQGLQLFFDAVKKTSILAYNFDVSQGETKPSTKIQLAGKNVGSFDWQIIKNQTKRIGLEFYREILSIDHRTIDCGDIFFDQFGKNPGFAAVNKLIGWKDINHDALDDAVNVVVALRYRMGMNF